MKNSFRIDHAFLRLIFGRRWREKVWASKSDAKALQTQIIVSGTPFLCERSSVKRIKIKLDLPNYGFNPGLLKQGDGYLMIARCRASNFFNDRVGIVNPDSPIDVNYLIYLDHQYAITNKVILDESIFTRDNTAWTPPMEDVRLFNWGEDVWAIGAIHDRGRGKIEQALCKIENNAISQYQVLASPNAQKIEKNWIPIPTQEQLKIIYSFEPFHVMTLDSPNGELQFGDMQDATLGDHPFRGGTPLIPYREGYICLVHSAPYDYQSARLYTHHFVFFTKELRLAEIGRPFFLEHQGIEFVAGIVPQHDGILISYAVGDRVVRLMHIPETVIDCFLSID